MVGASPQISTLTCPYVSEQTKTADLFCLVISGAADVKSRLGKARLAPLADARLGGTPAVPHQERNLPSAPMISALLSESIWS